MNINIIILKILKTIDAVNKNLAEITSAATTGSIVYFNYINKTLDSLFSIATAVVSAILSYLAVRLCKYLINKWNDEK